MDSQAPMMTCDWCGSQFPADPRACVEAGVQAIYQPEASDEWKEPEPIKMPPHQLTQADRDRLKASLELDDVQLNQLLTTGNVKGLGAIVCLNCQDTAAANARGMLTPTDTNES